MDFYQIKERTGKSGSIEIYPDFKVGRSNDIMVRGKSFYAIWDEEKRLWSTDEYDVPRLVDKELFEYKKKIENTTDSRVHVKTMAEFSTASWTQYKNWLARLSDSSKQLDTTVTFQNTEVSKRDYVSKRLPYSLEQGSTKAYDEIVGTLYLPEERDKLEWAIGAIISGDARDIQKFIVIYGEAGAGKSTFLSIVQKLFVGYYTTFDAKALTTNGNSFSTEVFRSDPVVAIQHDGDLSKIEDNSKLNSIISHEMMTMNEKYKPSYTARANCFLFMATNKPVKITDAKSGIIRRLIDVRTSGKKIPVAKYFTLMSQVDFELGAIAYKCLEKYKEMGKNYYSAYRPLDMIFQTDVFFNFVESYYPTFLKQDGVSLSQAYSMYKEYCDEALIDFKLARHKFREELKNYFRNFSDVTRIDGKQVRSFYSGFITSKFETGGPPVDEPPPSWIVLDKTESIFDRDCKDCSAQYANDGGTPYRKWSEVKTRLSDLDTTRLHYVVLPSNHIVIDFDLVNEKGEKSPEDNIKAASSWPPTYAEYSKSQSGIHLHYIYDGDVNKLSGVYSDRIEVKVSRYGNVGPTSLRRKLSYCNNLPISTIGSGLPLKEEKVIDFNVVKSERSIRELIIRNLNKEIHPGTKPSIDFIYKILEDAYKSGMNYDVRDLRPRVLAFGNNSTNHSSYCISLVGKMRFKSEEASPSVEVYDDDRLVFFDVEVFPNLLMINWKYEGDKSETVHMINPEPNQIESLMRMKLVGYNCRRYDNHILYARYLGHTIEQIHDLSMRIIANSRNAFFSEAYNISYADVYDFSSKKQSLKKFQLELGILHRELPFPWDEPVSEDKIPIIAEYCDNDVKSLEFVFRTLKEDFAARQILAKLSGLSVNDTTQQHTARILFGNDPNPQKKFNYVDLSETFPGYKYENGVSSYRGENPGEGGYVYAEPGVYENVALLDVASMHPASILAMNMFGPYTDRYKELLNARLAIKHKDYKYAKTLLGGMLSEYLEDPDAAASLAYALKIHALNIVYGLTTAKFENKFKDPRNVDNIVAKRGALFMIDLKHAVQEKGYVVAHIKTDSIKIPNADKDIIDFVMEFGKKYGYSFELEGEYEKLCLVNDAVYIAKSKSGKWTAVGAQFAHPYVFKTLFSKERINFEDLQEMKSVSTVLYLDMNEGLGADDHNYVFIGKSGSFMPVKPGSGGGVLYREKDGKYYAASGTKGYRWMETDMVRATGKESEVDLNYFRKLVDDATTNISKHVDLEWFIQ